MSELTQILVLLGLGVFIIVSFLRYKIPSSLGYLLIGAILSPHTMGPTLDMPQLKSIAEFGVVFLLFTIGLNYSLPQIRILRGQVVTLGTAQVALSTIIVGSILYMFGVDMTVAFVIGAIFAQSSSTIIASQLLEQKEDQSTHGRLGLAMSVYQDVTAVPFIVIIPVLGLAVSADILAMSIGWAMAKAILAFFLVFFAGKWLLKPLFNTVTLHRSSEAFTLTVLMVVLLASWSSFELGLSLAFGAFLAGMMLGETEFRHQVESSIRPFRDVLLGLFFVSIGMIFNPVIMPDIWHLAILGALTILISKIIIVSIIVKKNGLELIDSIRTALLVSVGGEFGFALLAIALDSGVIDAKLGQILLTSVLFSLIGGSILIKFNYQIAAFLSRESSKIDDTPEAKDAKGRVVIAGYGRFGRTLAVFMEEKGIDYIVFDNNPKRIADGKARGHNMAYGDISDFDLLDTIQIDKAALVAIVIDESEQILRTTLHLRQITDTLPIIARAEDAIMSRKLLDAGATHSHPEAIEASLSLGAAALNILDIPNKEIGQVITKVREQKYNPILASESGSPEKAKD